MFGSYQSIGLRDDVCFDRYGRYGAYGLGYSAAEGGTGWGMHGDQSQADPVWASTGHLNWSSVDLGDAQRRCVTRNRKRFHKTQQDYHQAHSGSLSNFSEINWEKYRPQGEGLPVVPRTAIILRTWEGMDYKPGVRLYLRSLVNELSLYSGGEYDVHLLIEVKNASRPIWASEEEYDKALTDLVPEEFRSMATLWNQQLMQLIYPGPFQPQFHEHGSMYPAMRSMHFALQWFMIQHPEYEYFWNWEMDIRYIGHWYELFDRARTWAKTQPRRHAWTRSARYYISALYDDWKTFSHDSEQRAIDDPIDHPEFAPNPTPGHERDKEEEADFITFNPIFNPQNTNWNRREDVTGYDTNQPIPERRSAIVAASRFSRRLLLAMHYENYHNRHSMASEMFPPTMALHHGLKAVYVPHPVYLERDWTAQNASEIFNGGPFGDTGNFPDSVFGDGPKGNQMALMQSTYFYDAKFAEMLWWRWGGYELYQYGNEGGAKDELSKDRNGVRKGRMCLRSMLFHPVKYDEGRSY